MLADGQFYIKFARMENVPLVQLETWTFMKGIC